MDRAPSTVDTRTGVRRLSPAMSVLLVTFSMLTALAVVVLFVLADRTDRAFAWTI